LLKKESYEAGVVEKIYPESGFPIFLVKFTHDSCLNPFLLHFIKN